MTGAHAAMENAMAIHLPYIHHRQRAAYNDATLNDCVMRDRICQESARKIRERKSAKVRGQVVLLLILEFGRDSINKDAGDRKTKHAKTKSR